MHMASAGQLLAGRHSVLFHQGVLTVATRGMGCDLHRGRGEGSDPRARLPGQRVGIGAARPDLGGESAEIAVRVRDDFELFLLKLDGQHRAGGRVYRLTAGVIEVQQVCGKRQGTAIVGIHYQEFFLDTKSTHLTSGADEGHSVQPHQSRVLRGFPARRGAGTRSPRCGYAVNSGLLKGRGSSRIARTLQ